MVEYMCNLCSKKFNHKGTYMRHINKKYSCVTTMTIITQPNKPITIIAQPDKPITINGKNECSYCNKNFTSLKSLRRHNKYYCAKLKIRTDVQDDVNILKQQIIEMHDNYDDIKSKYDNLILNITNNNLVVNTKNNNNLSEIIPNNDNLMPENLNEDKINYKQIPKNIKAIVWNKYIGKENGIGPCYVCQTDIDAKHFEAGHIKARAVGGSNMVDNLRPVCSLCNKSIGKNNMDKFKEYYLNVSD